MGAGSSPRTNVLMLAAILPQSRAPLSSRAATVSGVLTVGFSHARYPSGIPAMQRSEHLVRDHGLAGPCDREPSSFHHQH